PPHAGPREFAACPGFSLENLVTRSQVNTHGIIVRHSGRVLAAPRRLAQNRFCLEIQRLARSAL
ncbi:hypothetical protein, partial [Methylobacterium crusticola]|uniref:hypothetical protein n=1 Tax=Methylobacterium crusticola TaxID=1697972 RepID=UPI001939F81D